MVSRDAVDKQRRTYNSLYSLDPRYGRAGAFRTTRPIQSIRECFATGSRTLLDVACGRGWFLQAAKEIGYTTAHGYEIVPRLCNGSEVFLIDTIESLPTLDSSYDVVSCLDVLEHLYPEQVDAAIAELIRVARSYLILSIPHWACPWNGVETHLTVREPAWWESKLPDTGVVNHFDARWNMSHFLVQL